MQRLVAPNTSEKNYCSANSRRFRGLHRKLSSQALRAAEELELRDRERAKTVRAELREAQARRQEQARKRRAGHH